MVREGSGGVAALDYAAFEVADGAVPNTRKCFVVGYNVSSGGFP